MSSGSFLLFNVLTSLNDHCCPPGINLPEGVDPSFLAALPEDIRREVLQNQLGIRPPSRPPVASTLPSSTTPVLSGPGVTEVSPEFLAALPPAIQEEVRRHFLNSNTISIISLTSTRRIWCFSIAGVPSFFEPREP